MSAAAESVTESAAAAKPVVFKKNFRYGVKIAYGNNCSVGYLPGVYYKHQQPAPTAVENELRAEVDHWKECFYRAAEKYDLLRKQQK